MECVYLEVVSREARVRKGKRTVMLPIYFWSGVITERFMTTEFCCLTCSCLIALLRAVMELQLPWS